MFRVLITFALLLVFGGSAYMSVYGFMAVFEGIWPVVLAIGAGMELGKILIVIYLHRHWRRISWLGRVSSLAVVMVLCCFTALEVMGFLTQRHAVAVQSAKILETDIHALESEAALLREQIQVIDDTLGGLPKGYVTRRIRERKDAGYRAKEKRLIEIARKRAELKSQIVRDQSYLAPVFATARIFRIDADRAVSLFVLLTVCILEPLSLGLAVATSAVWMRPVKMAKRPIGQRTNRLKWPNGQEAEAAKGLKGQNGQMIEAVSGPNGQNTEVVMAAGQSGQMADGRTAELLEIQSAHHLTAAEIAKITDRQEKTVGNWLSSMDPIPIKQLRLLRRWAKSQRKLRILG